LDLNATEETRVNVPSISRALFLIGLINYYLAFILTIKLFNYIAYSLHLFAIIYIVPIIILYYINEKVFKEGNYKGIESRFDKKNKLKKTHFILLAVLYLFGSVVTLILAGININ
jgi:hypothetical protein